MNQPNQHDTIDANVYNIFDRKKLLAHDISNEEYQFLSRLDSNKLWLFRLYLSRRKKVEPFLIKTYLWLVGDIEKKNLRNEFHSFFHSKKDVEAFFDIFMQWDGWIVDWSSLLIRLWEETLIKKPGSVNVWYERIEKNIELLSKDQLLQILQLVSLPISLKIKKKLYLSAIQRLAEKELTIEEKKRILDSLLSTNVSNDWELLLFWVEWFLNHERTTTEQLLDTFILSAVNKHDLLLKTTTCTRGLDAYLNYLEWVDLSLKDLTSLSDKFPLLREADDRIFALVKEKLKVFISSSHRTKEDLIALQKKRWDLQQFSMKVLFTKRLKELDSQHREMLEMLKKNP